MSYESYSLEELRELFINANLRVASIPPGEYQILIRMRDSKGRVAELATPVIFEK